MANATSIAVTELTANGDIDQPTAQVLDTGTAAVTIETADQPHLGRIWLQVTNLAAQNLTVTAVASADNPPSFRSGLGNYTTGNIAQNGVKLIGPFEGARFRQQSGKLKVTFTPASGTINATFQAYRLPRQ